MEKPGYLQEAAIKVGGWRSMLHSSRRPSHHQRGGARQHPPPHSSRVLMIRSIHRTWFSQCCGVLLEWRGNAEKPFGTPEAATEFGRVCLQQRVQTRCVVVTNEIHGVVGCGQNPMPIVSQKASKASNSLRRFPRPKTPRSKLLLRLRSFAQTKVAPAN